MQVKELIFSPLTSCNLDTDVAEARDILEAKGITAMPVINAEDAGSLEGIVTFHDLAGVYDDNVNIQQVMSTKIYAVTHETSIETAARIMIDKKIHHLVAMEGSKIIGIVSSLDYVRLVAESKSADKSA